LLILFLFHSNTSYAKKGVYQTSKQFIQKSFLGVPPSAKVMWLSKEDKQIIMNILSHKFNRLRLRYWQIKDETVWIINEIGKEKPITIGVHLKADYIVKLKVLTFRESRGDEVRHDFFSKQFNHLALTENNHLNKHVDGITGATLSVRALTKVARLALWLHAKAILKT